MIFTVNNYLSESEYLNDLNSNRKKPSHCLSFFFHGFLYAGTYEIYGGFYN